jgi:hypothetical protein
MCIFWFLLHTYITMHGSKNVNNMVYLKDIISGINYLHFS